MIACVELGKKSHYYIDGVCASILACLTNIFGVSGARKCVFRYIQHKKHIMNVISAHGFDGS